VPILVFWLFSFIQSSATSTTDAADSVRPAAFSDKAAQIRDYNQILATQPTVLNPTCSNCWNDWENILRCSPQDDGLFRTCNFWDDCMAEGQEISCSKSHMAVVDEGDTGAADAFISWMENRYPEVFEFAPIVKFSR
jgi:hypothetical protein